MVKFVFMPFPNNLEFLILQIIYTWKTLEADAAIPTSRQFIPSSDGATFRETA